MMNVAVLNWFALPDGSYWSVQEGKGAGNLSTRAYFPKVLAGEAVIGDLVVSKATGKSVAIVAVPLTRRTEPWPVSSVPRFTLTSSVLNWNGRWTWTTP